MSSLDRRPPVWSSVGLCCPVLIVGVIYFLSTPQGQAFNERTFGRYYTAGALLMIGVYGAVLLGLFAAGIGASVMAWKREEEPLWLRQLATAANVIPPIAYFLFVSYT
ncbi:MAG TPA: hypothetical protein VJR92_15275 [Gemmatimonadaceae bacterium]|nr:hypothetical protein [Gemmatimonadaceae bacterium]